MSVFSHVSYETFLLEVIDESFKRLVILDISAQWCGPCKVLDPIINSVANNYSAKEVSFVKLEAEDENMKIAGEYAVRGFPTVIAFINGKESARFHSAQTADFVADFIDEQLELFSLAWCLTFCSYNLYYVKLYLFLRFNRF